MARRPNAEPIYKAADTFRRRCLTTGDSLLSPDHKAWTPTTVRHLWEAIIGHPDEGQRNFEEKLRDQLAPLSDDAYRVAAEAVGIYYLFSSKVGAETKRAKVGEILSWRFKTIPSLGLLDEAFASGGIGYPGAHYSTSKPWQLAYLLKFAELALSERADLTDLGACKALADRVRAAVPQAGEARHILLHLFFPDHFERIASENHKRRIFEAFSEHARGIEDIDSALESIRKSLGMQYRTSDVDFYDPQIKSQWFDLGDEDSLKEGLQEILTGYVTARAHEPFSGQSQMYQLFRRLQTLLQQCEPVKARASLSVNASPGQGNWSKVPWIAILDTRVTSTTQKGVYCVYLFREDMSGVYLTLNQGVTDPRRREGWAAAEQLLRHNAAELRRAYPVLGENGFSLADDLDLRTQGDLGEAYEVSTIAHKLYKADKVPSDEELLLDLDRVLDVYEQYVQGQSAPKPSKTAPPRVAPRVLRAVVEEFASAARENHLSFGSRHEDTIRAFVASIATKRFAILTGLSGSGKTQLALRFGEWLGPDRSLVIPA